MGWQIHNVPSFHMRKKKLNGRKVDDNHVSNHKLITESGTRKLLLFITLMIGAQSVG